MANIGSGRVLRVCDLCGGVDDHPRHVIAGTAPDAFPKPSDDIIAAVAAAAFPDEVGRLLRELTDTSSSDRHLDCCAAEGCPNGTCGPQVSGAGGKTGKALMNHLASADVPDRSDVVKGE